MRIILLGPPGSGKGTQAKLLSKRLGLTYIGTGDLLREAVRLDTTAGRIAKDYLATGRLVPDDLVNEMVKERFGGEHQLDKFVLDGYPRTVAQASSFDQLLRQHFLDIGAVVRLVVPDDEIVARLTGRWICPNPACQITYHTAYKPPKVAGVCDVCGTALTQRVDDREETVRKRLQIYRQMNVDILAYYRARGLLREVPSTGDIETIYNRIVKTLDSAP